MLIFLSTRKILWDTVEESKTVIFSDVLHVFIYE